MRDLRDLRDPAILGHLYRAARGRGSSIEVSANQMAPSYDSGGHMSSDPKDHHLNRREDDREA